MESFDDEYSEQMVGREKPALTAISNALQLESRKTKDEGEGGGLVIMPHEQGKHQGLSRRNL